MIRSANMDDEMYIESLMRHNYEAVGFMPMPRVREYIRSGQVLLAMENGDPCGYLLFGNGWPQLKIYQACIQYDARRREYGFSLVRELVKEADRRSCSLISLWCADDLDANQFWKMAGFVFTGTRAGGIRRGRNHNSWVLPLTQGQMLLPGLGIIATSTDLKGRGPVDTRPERCCIA